MKFSDKLTFVIGCSFTDIKFMCTGLAIIIEIETFIVNFHFEFREKSIPCFWLLMIFLWTNGKSFSYRNMPGTVTTDLVAAPRGVCVCACR